MPARSNRVVVLEMVLMTVPRELGFSKVAVAVLLIGGREEV
jgi:hypothetical protein